MPPTHPTHRYFLWLALLVIALALVGFAFGFGLLSPAPVEDTSAPAGFPTDAPPPKPQDYVAAQKGFQYLVSYTDAGFQPARLTVQKGETVRFTNNSNGTLQLSLEGAPALGYAQYFEYTFTKSSIITAGINTVQVTVQ